MIAAFAVHGQFLFAHGAQGNANWVSIQLNGLGTLGLTMPELNGAASWFTMASRKSPLATENLLENTDDGGRSTPISVLSGRQPATFRIIC